MRPRGTGRWRPRKRREEMCVPGISEVFVKLPRNSEPPGPLGVPDKHSPKTGNIPPRGKLFALYACDLDAPMPKCLYRLAPHGVYGPMQLYTHVGRWTRILNFDTCLREYPQNLEMTTIVCVCCGCMCAGLDFTLCSPCLVQDRRKHLDCVCVCVFQVLGGGGGRRHARDIYSQPQRRRRCTDKRDQREAPVSHANVDCNRRDIWLIRRTRDCNGDETIARSAAPCSQDMHTQCAVIKC